MKTIITKLIALTILVICANITTTQAQVTKKVIFEEFTGTWCGLCPEGNITFQNLLNNYENAIGVGVHISDPMTVEAGNELASTYSGGGVNIFLLDRYKFEDLDFVQFSFAYEPLAEKLEERMNMTSPVAISLQNTTFDEVTRELTVTVKADFYDYIATDDVRFNLWLTEDSIMSSTTGFNQTNFFDSYDGHPYAGAGNPIINYTHHNVLRANLGGTWGTEGSLPIGSSIEPGDSHTYTYTTTLDASWNYEQIQLIGMVQAYDTEHTAREIMNAENMMLPVALENNTATGITANNATASFLNVYPNPATSNQKINIEFAVNETTNAQIDVYNVMGSHIASLKNESVHTGTHAVTWNGSDSLGNEVIPGMYLISIKTGEGEIVEKVSIVNPQ